MSRTRDYQNERELRIEENYEKITAKISSEAEVEIGGDRVFSDETFGLKVFLKAESFPGTLRHALRSSASLRAKKLIGTAQRSPRRCIWVQEPGNSVIVRPNGAITLFTQTPARNS